jgi:hypothetical protein
MLPFNSRLTAFVFAVAAMLITAFPALMRAQIDMGGVAGTVKDPSGAAVPAAVLTLTNEATNVAQKGLSSSTGTYVFEAVPVGSYRLKAEAPGFAPICRKTCRFTCNAWLPSTSRSRWAVRRKPLP